jgi:predicted acyl esterase
MGVAKRAAAVKSGWTDAYTNAIPRLLERLTVPHKGLIGPWAHGYPHFALPGPQIGFLKEMLRGGIIGSRASIPASWMSPCCALG